MIVIGNKNKINPRMTEAPLTRDYVDDEIVRCRTLEENLIIEAFRVGVSDQVTRETVLNGLIQSGNISCSFNIIKNADYDARIMLKCWDAIKGYMDTIIDSEHYAFTVGLRDQFLYMTIKRQS